MRPEAWRPSARFPATTMNPCTGIGRASGRIRLSRAYRALYVVKEDEEGTFVSIEEVSKHDY